jgi:hypothetical protein
MKTDMIIAMQLSLVAINPAPAPSPTQPLHPIHQELLDYVNSPEYRQLEIKEFNERRSSI